MESKKDHSPLTIPKKNNFLRYLLLVLALLGPWLASAQQVRYLTLKEAIKMGVDSSKTLQLSLAQINEAEAKYQQTLDGKLPTASASLGYSEAFLPTNKIQFPGSQKPIQLNTFNSVYLGTLSVNETIFAGNKLKFAKQSALLLKKIASLQANNNQQGVIQNIIESYYNLYKVKQSQKIISQNLDDIGDRLKETRQFEQQGLATKNDVLRWELQQSNTQLTGMELDDNRKIINYNMDILLGLPENTQIEPDSSLNLPAQPEGLSNYLALALSHRNDLATYEQKSQLAEIQIKNIENEKLPRISGGLSMYYINPQAKIIPAANSYLLPITLGVNVGWNMASLWTTKNKLSEALIQKQETQISQNGLQDQIRMEIFKTYTDYLQSLDKINVLKTAVEQATENDRIMESKYQNQLASTTDRIDAQTLLYQARINLELAKVDAKIAYYQLLKSTGTLQ
ncbi:MAG: TolC family protein [Chitinophagaceae bacterium]